MEHNGLRDKPPPADGRSSRSPIGGWPQAKRASARGPPIAKFTRRAPNQSVAESTFDSKKAIRENRSGFPVKGGTLCYEVAQCPARISVFGLELTNWVSKLLHILLQEDGIEA